MKTEEEEEERRVCLEKRLEPNVDFDDALQVLDSTRISNLKQPWMGAILYGVGMNTHKELDSEVLMTLAPTINEGVSCLSFCLEDEKQLVPYGCIGELLGYKKKARSKLMSKKKMLGEFLGNDFERRLQHYVKTSNRSRSICNRLLTPVTSTHICNGCCLAPVTYNRARTTSGLASTTPVTNVDF
jgi:hypothetical protein